VSDQLDDLSTRIRALENELGRVRGELRELAQWRSSVEHRFTLQGTKCNVALARSGQAHELLRQIYELVVARSAAPPLRLHTDQTSRDEAAARDEGECPTPD
jgi:hypothetical protein